MFFEFKWGRRGFHSREAFERAVNGLINAQAISRKYKGVKGFAFVKTKKGGYKFMILKNALMAKDAGNVIEIIETAKTLKELKEKIENLTK